MTDSIASRVVDAFGGTHATARALDTPASTVQSWKKSGRIPRWWRKIIIDAAEYAHLPLPPEFLEPGA